MSVSSHEQDALKRAAVAIRSMRAELAKLEASRHEPIAIVGMACRFPGRANSPEAFWELLDSGTDAVTEVPPERWPVEDFYSADPEAPLKSYSRHMGYVADVDQFDARLFRISPREAAGMDPQQRLLLEVTWEALEDAFIVPKSVIGSSTGVFVGITAGDYGQLAASVDSHSLTGNVTSIAVGRISYTFGLKGPCYPIDTACSSSLVSLHAACQSLRAGECDTALAGGVHLILSPVATIGFSKLRALSPDGKCKTFDASADGYVRGEGCGVVVLKRLSDALANGDRIHAIVRGSAVNQDGRSSGLTAPHGPSQQAVIRAALAQARLSASEVSYVEAHGTGTSLGDPIEIQALDAVYRHDRTPDAPLLVGSVKTNVGHLELAAGMASLLKVVLSLKHERIPKHLHFQDPNPNVSWEDLRVSVTREPRPWRRGSKRRIAGLSGFGFSGTNAHAVLEEAPAVARAARPERSHHVLLLSAATRETLIRQAERYAAHLNAHPDQAIADVCLTAATARTHFDHRLAVVSPTTSELQGALQTFTQHGESNDVVSSNGPLSGKLAFLCGGQCPPDAPGGLELHRDSSEFRDALEACYDTLQQLGETPPHPLHTLEEGALEERVLAGFCSQYAYAALWRSYGVRPDVVVGHGAGEVVAACIAGALPLHDALKLVISRARIARKLANDFVLVAIRARDASLHSVFADCGARVVAWEASDPVVLAARHQLPRLRSSLERGGYEHLVLQDSATMGVPPTDEPEYSDLVRKVAFATPHCPLVSSSGHVFTEAPTGETWLSESLECARLGAIVGATVERGVRTFIELSPDASLLPNIRHLHDDVTLVSTARRGESEWKTVLRAVGTLYAQGRVMNWSAITAPFGAGHVDLPTYAFDRQRYWFDTDTPLALPAPATQSPASLLGSPARLSDGRIHLTTRLSVEQQPQLKDHLVYDTVVVPGAFYIAGVLEAATHFGGGPVKLDDLLFREALQVPGECTLETVLTKLGDGEFQFEILGSNEGLAAVDEPWRNLASGTVSLRPAPSDLALDVAAIRNRCRKRQVDDADLSSKQATAVWRGPSFQWAREAWRGSDEALVRFEMPEVDNRTKGTWSPGLLDSLWDCLLGALPGELLASATGPFLPFGIGSVRLLGAPRKILWGHGQLHESSEGQASGDIVVVGEDGERLLEMQGVVLRAAPASKMAPTRREPTAYSVRWRRADAPAFLNTVPQDPQGTWLVLGRANPFARQLESQLRRRGERSILAEPGSSLVRHAPSHYSWNADRPEGLAELLADLAPRLELRGILDVRHLDSARTESALNPSDLLHTQGRACSSTLSLAHTLLRREVGGGAPSPTTPRLVIVTRGACAVDHRTRIALEHATLTGLCRTIATEHPELRILHLDLDPSGEDDPAIVVGEATTATGAIEVEVAYRDNARHVARLVPASSNSSDSNEEITIRSDATYLVTGGTGGLGLRFSRWLVERGARHLVLISRRGATANAESALVELRQLGARVRVREADVTRRSDLKRVFDDIERDLPPLAGVIHAAGVIDDGALTKQTWERFAHVMGPKVSGSHYLHELTRDLPLDFFVLFSSIAAVMGTAGQSNYAAANAYMDALAHERRRTGLPALSIAWGAWEGTGMAAARSDEATARAEAAGIGSIRGVAGIAAFERALGQGQPHLAIADIDWRRSLAQVEQDALPGLLEHFRHHGRARSSRPPAVLAERLKAASERERATVCLDFVRSEVQSVLGLGTGDDLPDEAPLTDLGMDSLLAVDLRNALSAGAGLALEPTIAFMHPTCAALADQILRRWEKRGDPEGTGATTPPPAALPGVTTSARWFPHRTRKGEPRVRLLCLPYILGSASVFSTFQDHLPPGIEVCAAELPGHWTRGNEESCESIEEIVSKLLPATRELMDTPLALFGYSIGALIAFELSRALREQDGVSPQHLFVASLHAPQVRVPRPDIISLNDEELLAHFERAYGPVARALVVDDESRQHFVRNARADLKCLANYPYSDAPPLSCPITSLGAEDDPLETIADMRAWSQQTVGPFEFHSFLGGHLFVQSHARRVTELLASTLNKHDVNPGKLP